MVAALGAPPASADAARPTHKRHERRPPESPCGHVPVGWKVVASETRVVVIKRDLNRTDKNGNTTTWSWRYCLRPGGRYFKLYTDSSGYDGAVLASATYTDPVLSGRYAATTVTYSSSHLGFVVCTLDVNVFKLTATGAFASGGANVADCGSVSISGLVVNARGFAAWVQKAQLAATSTGPHAVSCPSVSLCVGVDAAGNVDSSTDPLGGRAAWSVSPVARGLPGADSIDAVSCPTVGFCAAVSGLIVLTSTDPAGGVSAWPAATVDDTRLTSISCPSESLCVAGDIAGDLLVSTDPTGGAGAWTKVAVDSGPIITGVSCASTSLCVATDWRGNVIASNDPAGGAQAWSIANVDTPPEAFLPLFDVSCPSSSLCIAPAWYGDPSGGLIAVSTNPAGGAGAWTLVHVGGARGLAGSACASTSLCVVFDNDGDVITSTDPAGGPAAWTRASPPIVSGVGEPITSVSCPSASLCVGVRGDGDGLVTSTNPTGGSTAWKVTPVNVPDCALTTPCIAEQLVAIDNSAAHVLDSAPPGTGQVISKPTLRGNTVTWTDAGAAHQHTLH
jgi:hypothetical protein